MFVTSGVISAKRKYVESGEPKGFCSLTDTETDDIVNVLVSDEVILSAYKDK